MKMRMRMNNKARNGIKCEKQKTNEINSKTVQQLLLSIISLINN